MLCHVFKSVKYEFVNNLKWTSIDIALHTLSRFARKSVSNFIELSPAKT